MWNSVTKDVPVQIAVVGESFAWFGYTWMFVRIETIRAKKTLQLETKPTFSDE